MQTERIRIPLGYWPRQQFKPFHKRDKRWSCLVCHRRAGKTVACIMDLVDEALRSKKENARFAYIAPLHVQAKDVAWTYLKQYTAPIPGVQINESELRVDFPSGARIRLYGADNYDRMRGIYLDGVILDEAADFDPRAWPEVLRPALSDRQGWATFIGTPKGRNFFWEVWEGAQNNPDWFALMLRASETGIVNPDELADARSMMTPEQYAQEYECSFDAAILGAYFGKEIADAEAQGRIGEVPHDPAIPTHTSWDLGMGDSTAIWFWQVGPEGVRIIDAYENHGQNLAHYVAELKTRPYKYGNDYVPHDAKVRDLSTGRTRVETLISLGRKPVVVPDHKLMDGINALRVSFPRIRIDASKCKFGLEALRQYRTEYDEKAKVFKNTPKHDWTSHFADSARYMAVAWREMVMPKEKPKLNVNTATPTLKDILAHHDRAVKSRDHKRI
jgi:phage terminase large subunit